MSVYDLFFVFGKAGTYLIDHPRNYTTRNMPDYFNKSVKENGLIQKVKCLALDANNNFYMAWENRKYANIWTKSGIDTNYPSVKNFIFKLGRTATDCFVVFGSTVGDYIAVCGGAWEMRAAGWTIDQAIMDDKRHIKSAALGMNQAYFILYTDGGYRYACNVNYPDLAAILSKCERGDVVFVAMNPHRKNEYFIALANGRVHIRASAVCEADIVSVLSLYDNLEVISSHVSNFSHEVASKPTVPQQYRKREFLKSIATSVAGSTTTALVTAALTASCTVM